jgi:hypothetical protein
MMTMIYYPSDTISWMAIAVGVVSLIGLVLLILFFTVGQPFGTLNDVFIGLAAILSALLAWMLYPLHHVNAPTLSLFALIAAILGALIVAAGAILVIFGVKGWFLAGLFMMSGNALMGVWLLLLNATIQPNLPWPRDLVLFGVIAGVIMAVGLLTSPGIFSGMDDMQSAPWFVNVGQVSALGWLLLYPIWCIWLGRLLSLDR